MTASDGLLHSLNDLITAWAELTDQSLYFTADGDCVPCRMSGQTVPVQTMLRELGIVLLVEAERW